MEIKLSRWSEKASDDILKIWEQIQKDVDECVCGGVEDREGVILSHNAYLLAHLGVNANSTCIELRAKNDDRLLATHVFYPSGESFGFVGKTGKLVKLF